MRSIEAICALSISRWTSSGCHCSSAKLPTSGTTNSAVATHMLRAWLRTSCGKSASRNSSARRQRGGGVR